MGENGAGKSTLAKIIAGSVKADSGRIFPGRRAAYRAVAVNHQAAPGRLQPVRVDYFTTEPSAATTISNFFPPLVIAASYVTV